MRIVAGRLKGREITAPDGRETRPTSDRVRQSLFNILEHGLDDFSLHAARVIDLFAGSGALGFEALSRGAESVIFVETGMDARAAIRENTTRFALAGQTRVLKRDATDIGPRPRGQPYNLVFLDPPYGQGLGEKALTAVIVGGWLAAGAIIVLEERKGVIVAWPDTCECFDTRTYGDTSVHFARLIEVA
ncbi:MAG: 16S rRNA (guanine(966)-N(2))-methyltransferase RsmD [Pseudomonadota bacterium]